MNETNSKDRKEFLRLAEKYEKKGHPILAGMFRVAAGNNRSRSNWKPAPKPPLGKIRKMK